MQVVFINKCKSCEIKNQMFFNIMFSFLKTKDQLVMKNIAKQNYLVVPFHMVCLMTQACLEPSQTSPWEHFCKNS